MNFRIVTNLWLIPAVPFAASLVILSLSKARRKTAAALAVAGQIAALAMSVLAFLPTLQTNNFRVVQNFTWFTFGEEVLRLGFVLDPLAAAMLMMIALVGLCIFVFSIGYMADDKRFTRFFAYLSFFSGAMLGLVIANSLLLLFVFWELVGLASYLLIGFWIERPSAAAAAKKAFITTRIGDMGFFLGMLWLYNRSGTLLFYDGGTGCLESAGLALLGASATFIALLIFFGAVGKSGQFPLHVWLPDAMEGPTPVSALIHAATMVAAGVFLVARVYPLFSLGAINGVTSSLTVVVWIGVTTTLWPRSHAPDYLILAGIILTALYMTRQIIYVFFGNARAASDRVHESPRVMTMPLTALALCTIFFGVVLTPAWPRLHAYLTGEPAHFEITRLIQPMFFVSLVLVSAGVVLGIWMYRKAGAQARDRPAEIDPLEYAQPALFRFLANKMWIDEFYGRTVIAFSWAGARLSDWMDRYFWDGLVRGFGAVGQLFAMFTTSVDERGINAGVDETTAGTRGLGRLLSTTHSGQIQIYLGVVAIGMLALLLLYAWLA